MLSRRFTRTVATPVALAAGVQATSAARTYYLALETMGQAHPDVRFGNMMMGYRGRGWANMSKQLPAESMTMHGGDTMTHVNDRHGHVQDPEDPRHPIVRAQFGPEHQKGMDGAVHAMVHGNYGPIPRGSRLIQVLYNNYLEPLNMSRVCVPLMHLHKTPNNNDQILFDSCEYIGQTAQLIGNVMVGIACVICEGCVIRADTNQIYIQEGCQIMENVCMIADAPTTLHHYQRQEMLNPYQTLEISEGLIKIAMNTMIEPNCMIESCNLGAFNRIGHGTKILKGVTSSIFVHVLPGSVVLPDTHMAEGEIWGGAPARKLGKVSKFEYKKPWMATSHHKEQTNAVRDNMPREGDQHSLWMEEMDKLENLMIAFEDGITPGVKAQMRQFIEGREPYGQMIARITQGWQPPHRDRVGDHRVPVVSWNAFRNHNDDAQSEYTGHVFNWRGYLSGAERKW